MDTEITLESIESLMKKDHTEETRKQSYIQTVLYALIKILQKKITI